MTQPPKCPTCMGTGVTANGEEWPLKCPTCHGTGTVDGPKSDACTSGDHYNCTPGGSCKCTCHNISRPVSTPEARADHEYEPTTCELCAAGGDEAPWHGLPTPRFQNELGRQIRLALNDAYQYGLEAQGHFDADLANAALEVTKRSAQAAITVLFKRVIDSLDASPRTIDKCSICGRVPWEHTCDIMQDHLIATIKENTDGK